MTKVLMLATILSLQAVPIKADSWKCSASPWGGEIDIHDPTAEVPFSILGFKCKVQPEQIDLAGTRKIFNRLLTCKVNGADISIEAFHTDFNDNSKDGEFYIQSGTKNSTIRIWWEKSEK